MESGQIKRTFMVILGFGTFIFAPIGISSVSVFLFPMLKKGIHNSFESWVIGFILFLVMFLVIVIFRNIFYFIKDGD